MLRGVTAGAAAATEPAAAPTTVVRPESSAGRARLVGVVTLLIVIVFGEAAIVAVVGVGRRLGHGANPLAWAIATVLNATLAYVLVGLPQVKAWERSGGRSNGPADGPADGADRNPTVSADPRARFAARTLSGGGLAAFVLASITGGPLAVGWFYGRRGDPRARSLTWAAAWLLAAVWSAVYLGVLAWAL